MGGQRGGLNMTRVLVLVTSMGIGGAERALQRLIRGIDNTRFDVGVCCLFEGGRVADELRAEGFDVVEAIARSAHDVRGFGQFARLLRSRPVDILYVNSMPATQLWAAAAHLLVPGVRVVSALHFSQRSRRRLRTVLVNRLTYRLTDRFVALSQTHRAFIMKGQRLPGERIVVIPNGVDVEPFEEAASNVRAAREALGLTVDVPVIGVLAALRPEKRHDLFLEAAVAVAARYPDAQFLLIGDGPERLRLEAAALRLGLGDRVVFAGAREDVSRVLCAVDIGVLCSRTEAFPLALLEFMAARRPVVASDVGSVREIVQDSVTGYIVPSDDVGALAWAIGRLLDEPLVAQKMGHQGYQRVSDHFRLDAMIRATEQLLAEVASSC